MSTPSSSSTLPLRATFPKPLQQLARAGRRRVSGTTRSTHSGSGLIPELVIRSSFYETSPQVNGPSEQLFLTVIDNVQNVAFDIDESTAVPEADTNTNTSTSVSGINVVEGAQAQTTLLDSAPLEFLRGAATVELQQQELEDLSQQDAPKTAAVNDEDDDDYIIGIDSDLDKSVDLEISGILDDDAEEYIVTSTPQKSNLASLTAAGDDADDADVDGMDTSSHGEKSHTPFAKPRDISSRLGGGESDGELAGLQVEGPSLLANSILQLGKQPSSQRDKSLTMVSLYAIASNAHKYHPLTSNSDGGKALTTVHLQVLCDLLRSSLLIPDVALSAAVVKVLRCVLLIRPSLAVAAVASTTSASRWSDDARKRVLISHLSRLAVGDNVGIGANLSGEALRCLECFLGDGPRLNSVPSSSSTPSASTSSRVNVPALEFCLGCVYAIAQEGGSQVPFDCFIALLSTLCRLTVRAVPALQHQQQPSARSNSDENSEAVAKFDPNLQNSLGATLCQSLFLALSSLCQCVQPPNHGHATTFGNASTLPLVLPSLLSMYKTFRAPRKLILILVLTLTKMHSYHGVVLIEGGFGLVVRGFVDHCCLLAKKGLALEASESALLAASLDVLAALLASYLPPAPRAACRHFCTPIGVGGGRDDFKVAILTCAQLQLLSALCPRHCGQPSYASLLRYAACLLDTAGDEPQNNLSASPTFSSKVNSIASFLSLALGGVREEIKYGVRVDVNCIGAAVASSALRLRGSKEAVDQDGSDDLSERETLAAVSLLVTAPYLKSSSSASASPEGLHVLLANEPAPNYFSRVYLESVSIHDRTEAILAGCLPQSVVVEIFPTLARSRSDPTGCDADDDDKVVSRSEGGGGPPEAEALSGGSKAMYTSLAAAARAFLHPVRFFTWPAMDTRTLHGHLLVLLALSRDPSSSSSSSNSSSTNTSERAHTGLLQLIGAELAGGYELVSLGEVVVMLLPLLTGGNGVVAAPSNPNSTAGTYLVAPHTHSLAMSRSLPEMRVTILLLLADILRLPRHAHSSSTSNSAPAPILNPLPAVRVASARLALLAKCLPLSLPVDANTSSNAHSDSPSVDVSANVSVSVSVEALACLQFLTAAANYTSSNTNSNTHTNSNAINNAVSSGQGGGASVNASVAMSVSVIESVGDIIARAGASDRLLLIGWLWALLRCPGALDSVSGSITSDDVMSAVFLRWVLWALRGGCDHINGNTNTSASVEPFSSGGSSAALALALDTCLLLQQVANGSRSSSLCQPVAGQALFRFLLSRPEVEMALTDLARRCSRRLRASIHDHQRRRSNDKSRVGNDTQHHTFNYAVTQSQALACVLDTIAAALDNTNTHPFVGYDCPGLHFPNTTTEDPSRLFGPRLLAALPPLLDEVAAITLTLDPAFSSPSSRRLRTLELALTLTLAPCLLMLATKSTELARGLALASTKDRRGRRISANANTAGANTLILSAALEWARGRGLALAKGLLTRVLASNSVQLFYSTALAGRTTNAGPLAAPASTNFGVGPWAAASVWERLGAASAALLACLLAETNTCDVSVDVEVGASFGGLPGLLDCVLDVLPDPAASTATSVNISVTTGGMTSSPARLTDAELCGCLAALAVRGCDVASSGRGHAALSLLERAASCPLAPEDGRLHNAAARLIASLARSSDVLRDSVCKGPLLRYLALVLLGLRGPVQLPRAVSLLREEARVSLDGDLLIEGHTLVLSCQAVCALSNTAARADRLHRACLPDSILWLMSKHTSYRNSLRVQRLGLAALLAVWRCPKVRHALLMQEGNEAAVQRAVGLLSEAVVQESDRLERAGRAREYAGAWPATDGASLRGSRHDTTHGGPAAGLGWTLSEVMFVRELLEQVAAQRTDVDCMMS